MSSKKASTLSLYFLFSLQREKGASIMTSCLMPWVHLPLARCLRAHASVLFLNPPPRIFPLALEWVEDGERESQGEREHGPAASRMHPDRPTRDQTRHLPVCGRDDGPTNRATGRGSKHLLLVVGGGDRPAQNHQFPHGKQANAPALLMNKDLNIHLMKDSTLPYYGTQNALWNIACS